MWKSLSCGEKFKLWRKVLTVVESLSCCGKLNCGKECLPWRIVLAVEESFCCGRKFLLWRSFSCARTLQVWRRTLLEEWKLTCLRSTCEGMLPVEGLIYLCR